MPLAATSLLPYAVASVWLKKMERYPGQRSALVDALPLYPRLEVEEVQVPAEELCLVARDVGVTAYDAAYLWLAARLGARLVTLDRRLAAAARRVGRSAPDVSGLTPRTASARSPEARATAGR